MAHLIQVLSPEVVAQIAAGEVIERPAAVIKELVENSLDAGASHIKVHIQEGGLSEITVWDNGQGIHQDDLPLTIVPHATSKINTASDLAQIHSFGFRGEALSVIAAVAEITIVSHQHDAESGYQLVSRPGQSPTITQAARPVGTTITVRNLFANVPARLKFMKTAGTEYQHILRIMMSFMVAHPEVRWELQNNGKSQYLLPASDPGDLTSRLENVLAVQAEKLLPVTYEAPGMTIRGFGLLPHHNTTKARFEELFVNHRPVQDRLIRKAVHQAYSDFQAPLKSPSFVLMIEVPADQVDVNVHPRKSEVKFINPYRVFASVNQAVAAAIQKHYRTSLNTNPASEAPVVREEGVEYRATPPAAREHGSSRWDRRMNQAESRLRHQHDLLPYAVPDYRPQLLGSESAHQVSSPQTIALDQIRGIFQVMDRYVIVDAGTQVWWIDQHAAAERIRYEELLHQVQGKPHRQLLMPEIRIPITPVEATALDQYGKLFDRLGFTVSTTQKEVVLTAVPLALAKSRDVEHLWKDLLSHVSGAEAPLSDAAFTNDEQLIANNTVKHVVATIACHNSLRANKAIPANEARALVEKLVKCDNPFACPHGRPTIWRLTVPEIDEHFERT